MLETALFVNNGSTHKLCVLMLFNDKDKQTNVYILEKILMLQVDVEDNGSANIDYSFHLRSSEDIVKASLVSLMRKKVP